MMNALLVLAIIGALTVTIGVPAGLIWLAVWCWNHLRIV